MNAQNEMTMETSDLMLGLNSMVGRSYDQMVFIQENWNHFVESEKKWVAYHKENKTPLNPSPLAEAITEASRSTEIKTRKVASRFMETLPEDVPEIRKVFLGTVLANVNYDLYVKSKKAHFTVKAGRSISELSLNVVSKYLMDDARFMDEDKDPMSDKFNHDMIDAVNSVATKKKSVRDYGLFTISALVSASPRFVAPFKRAVFLGMSSTHMLTRKGASDIAVQMIAQDKTVGEEFLAEANSSLKVGFNHLNSLDTLFAVSSSIDVASAVAKNCSTKTALSGLNTIENISSSVFGSSEKVRDNIEVNLHTLSTDVKDVAVKEAASTLYQKLFVVGPSRSTQGMEQGGTVPANAM